MHYHLEIIMPPTDDVEAAVREVLAPFEKGKEDSTHAFWDYWVIGGRFAGRKTEKALDPKQVELFYAWLKQEGVMVKGLQCGKAELADIATVVKVDAKWREMFPACGDKCVFFAHSNDQYSEHLAGDVLRICVLPPDLKCAHGIVACPGHAGKLAAVTMLTDQVYNGVQYVATTWDGSVAALLTEHATRISCYVPEYQAARTPGPDWIAVTVDYHS